MWLYPEWYQKLTAENIKYDADSIVIGTKADPSVLAVSKIEYEENYFSLVTMLNRIDTVPSIMALIRLLKEDSASPLKFNKSRLDIHALRLLELTQRASDVMKIKDIRETQRQDPVLNVLRTFTSLIGIESLQTRLDFCAPSDFITTVSDYGESVSADLILLPWTSTGYRAPNQQEVNPMDQIATAANEWTNYQMSDADFATSAYSITHCTVGLFIDRGFGHIQDGNPESQTNFQIIVPFTHGGRDDHAALIFALRLQMYRQAEVLVLQLSNDVSATRYATSSSIQSVLNSAQNTSQDQPLDSLFVSEQASNVILRSVKRGITNQSSEYYTVLNELEKPLDKHDLVVLGRSISNVSTLSAHTPTPLEGSTATPYSRGFKAALGNTAYQILSAGTLASLVVIQAPTEYKTSAEVIA
jgi:hypothetical protein